MGGRAEGLPCADPGARTPIGASGNFGPSVAVQTVVPLFLLSFSLLTWVTKSPEGLVVGFLNFAWAPNSQKY